MVLNSNENLPDATKELRLVSIQNDLIAGKDDQSF